jgi:FlaG/FlaF family flagellin (archaellin)
MNCPNCGRINPDDTIFCPSCGTAIHLSAPKKSGSNLAIIVIAVIAIVIALTVILAAVMYVMVLGIGGGSPPPTISMTKSSTADYLVATVVALSGSSMFSLSDMRLIVKNSSGTITLVRSPLSTMVSGVIYDGVMFQGLTPGYLNVGDDFLLDKHLYSPGSSITLTNIAGTAAYGVCSF